MGVVAFLPKFHSKVSHVPDEWDPAAQVGEMHPFRVIEVYEGQEVVISRRAALITDRVWEDVTRAYQDEATVKGVVAMPVKNGCVVNVLGAEGYLPDIGLSRNLRRLSASRLVGRELELRIVRIQGDQRRVVVSQRALEMDEETWRRFEGLRRDESITKGRVLESLPNGNGLVEVLGIETYLRAPSHGRHYLASSWQPADHVGEETDVRVVALDPTSRGVLVSHHAALVADGLWNRMKEAHRHNAEIEATVRYAYDGGYGVDVDGVDAVLPIGHADALAADPPAVEHVGKRVRAHILGLDNRDRTLVVSCRAVRETAKEVQRAQLEKELLPGQVREARVKRITAYGAFVDLGGMDALLHRSEMARYWVDDPKTVVRVGEDIDVKVLSVDREKGLISVSRKHLLPDPWLHARIKYPVGRRAIGTVKKLVRYGVMVDLEKGVMGLVHQSNVDWSSRRPPRSTEQFEPGDEIEVVVLEIDCADRRMSLGLKQLTTDPWLRGEGVYRPGTRLVGRVTTLVPFGVFVNVQPAVDGLVHLTDVTWGPDPMTILGGLYEGDEIEVVVLGFDSVERRLALGLKQVAESIQDLDAYGDELNRDMAEEEDREADARLASEAA